LKLKSMFADDQSPEMVVTLGTIHKVKGLESHTVTIICPEKIPHPMAKTASELQQEMNCLYVALTRSRRDLWFQDALPRVFEKSN
jgi:superfamily I DNA/RNA helicase